MSYEAGELIAEGKTKKVYRVTSHPDVVILQAKDDITAGDGAKHDVIAGKAALATETTCNVFALLKRAGLPVAFQSRLSQTAFLADVCQMLPYEVVTRREAHGSYLKRHPHVTKGARYQIPLVEWYLKTNGKRWKEHTLPKDDPLIRFRKKTADLFRPDQPLHGAKPILTLTELPLLDEREMREEMEDVARDVFTTLEVAWRKLGRTLVDMKIEFGFTEDGRLVVADVIDNDSWRVLEDGKYIDKQFYRDGGNIDGVIALYKHVAELTGRF